MTQEFLTGGSGAIGTFLFAHGAGAGMDSDFMADIADGLVNHGLKVVRFNFPYMALRAVDGRRRPPDRMPKLIEAFRRAVGTAAIAGPLLIGGKSMGGRVASLLAAEVPDIARGLVCLGYPFHPPAAPEKLRTGHLADIRMPALILQGERDPFGDAAFLAAHPLPPNFRLVPVPDGDHDFSPRKSSGRTCVDNRALAVQAVADFAESIRL